MNSHMFFTVHIYQYRVEKNSKNAGGGKTVFSQLGDSLNLDMLILLTDFLINSSKVSYENMAVYQEYVLILTVRTPGGWGTP